MRVGLFILLCAALAALGVVRTSTQVAAERTLSAALHEAAVRETVELNGNTYEVREGVVATSTTLAAQERLLVLRLAYAKALARRSPILGLPGIDTETLRIAAAQLAQTADALASRQATPQKAALVKNALYPVDYLYALALLEDARRAFLAAGNRDTAAAYHYAINYTLDALMEDIDSFHRAFQASVPATLKQYATPSALVSREGSIMLLKDLSRAAANLRAQANARTQCLQGTTARCVPGELRLSLRSVSDTTPIDSRARAQSARIVEAMRQVPVDFDPLFGSRLIQLRETACVPPGNSDPRVFVIRSAKTFMRDARPIPVYVGNWYFLEVPEGSNLEKLPYLESFASRGVRYVPMHALVYYECPSGSAEQGAVLSVRNVSVDAAHAPYSSAASGDERRALVAIERRLSAPVVSESDAAQYLRTALAARSLDPETRARAERAALAFGTKDAGLLAAALDVIEAEASNMRLADSGTAVDISAENLFFTRNAASALFMAHHPSLGVREQFLPNTLPAAKQPYRTLSELEAQGLSAHALATILRFYKEHYEF